jgi:hypothetical protein
VGVNSLNDRWREAIVYKQTFDNGIQHRVAAEQVASRHNQKPHPAATESGATLQAGRSGSRAVAADPEAKLKIDRKPNCYRVMDIFRSWASLALLAFESQSVVALRVAKMARGDAAAGREAFLMITEKIHEGGVAAILLASGASHRQIVKRYRRRVRANARRLVR